MDRALFDFLPVAINEVSPIFDDEGHLVDMVWTLANKAMNEAMMPDGGSIVGLKVFEFDAAYRDSPMVEATLDVMRTGESRTLITETGRFAQRLGSVIKTTLTRTETGVLACSHEVTELAQARDDAANSLALYETAFDHAVQGITMSNERGKFLYVNPAMHELLGYEPGELVGRYFAEMISGKDAQIMFEAGQRLFRGEIEQDTRDRILLTKTGGEILVSSAVSCAWSELYQQKIFIAHARDVRAERLLAAERKLALQEAEKATRLKSEFLANMSHEIRTPLNGVLGMAQALTFSGLNEGQSEQVNTIIDSGNTLMSILNDILDLSKIEAGKLEISKVETDLRHKLQRIQKLYIASAECKGIDLKVFIDPSVPSRLMLDPVRVRQCVDNLVSNAIKFTSEGEVVVAVTSEPDGEGSNLIRIHIADTGEGIAPDKLNHVFQTFAQADGSTTRLHGGSGLGLPITRRLATLMGGDITVESKLGRGSVFTMTFSAEAVAAEVEPDIAPAKVSTLPSAKVSSELSGCKVLVVDDNRINRRVVRMFVEYYGVVVTEACDGLEALKHLEHQSFDLVLMDIHMPIMDGIESFRQLRASSGKNSTIPVIALTADAMRGDKEKYEALGFDGYVSKPIHEPDLMVEIRRCLKIDAEQARAAS